MSKPDHTNALDSAEPVGDVNTLHKLKQNKVGIVAVLGVVAAVFIMVNLSSAKDAERGEVSSSEDMMKTVKREPGDKSSFALLSGQVNGLLGEVATFKDTAKRMNEYLDAQENQDEGTLQSILSTVNGTASQMDGFEARLKALETQRLSSGARDTFGQGSDGAARDPGSRAGSGAIPARPTNTDELFRPRGRQDLAGGGGPQGPTPVALRRTQNVIDLYPVSETETASIQKEAELKGAQVKATQPDVYDTENYVPPNAYVSARLVVSVDAAIGSSQSGDPKAAQFIITGPARHVQDGNKIEETDLTGCLVNGSAQGNLSSERVFINLHVMTCPLGNGKVAESKVEGYATHLGKNGVRGTVVSREGDLVTKAIIAGTLSGLGRTANQFGQGGGLTVGGSGAVLGDRPNLGEAAIGSAGSGISAGADIYSDYLLERARAYEPVVSLPTGIEVELVFISGTVVRPLEP